MRKFNVNILTRLFAIGGLIFLTIYCFQQNYLITGAICLSITILIFVSLLRYVKQTNRDIATFLESIRYNDFGTSFTSAQKGKSFNDLYSTFSTINEKFREIRAEKEIHHQYLNSIVEQVDIGLLVVNKEQKVLIMNNALKKLLHKSYLVDLPMLYQVNATLYDEVESLPVGERKVVKTVINDELLQVAIQRSELRQQEDVIQIYTFQNIQRELEEQELLAWQKLIRILTHEIMNSVTPVVSLSNTIHGMLDVKDGQQQISSLGDIRDGIQAIQKRSEGLLHFTETYRSLTKIPTPRFQEVNLIPLLDRIHTLFKPDLEKRNIRFSKEINMPSVVVQADPELIEQVIINLIKNAMEALNGTEDSVITLRAFTDSQDKINLIIHDNGPGIDPGDLEHIFVPFFTTKPNGTGIGLSLSRQIIQMHRGNLSVQSRESEGTAFRIVL